VHSSWLLLTREAYWTAQLFMLIPHGLNKRREFCSKHQINYNSWLVCCTALPSEIIIIYRYYTCMMVALAQLRILYWINVNVKETLPETHVWTYNLQWCPWTAKSCTSCFVTHKFWLLWLPRFGKELCSKPPFYMCVIMQTA